MQTIHSRTYTNVALTVLILLLLALVVRPYLALPTAQASPGDTGLNASGNITPQLDPAAAVAQALRELAGTNREIASAIRETGKAQNEVAQSIARLGVPSGK
jgi:hypothetical protein